MKTSIVILLPLLMVITLRSAGQKERSHEDFEKFKSQKISFLTEKMSLTPREAQEFWPVYNQSEKERMEIQHHRRTLEQKTRDENIKMDDQEIIKITRELTATFRKEADNASEFNERFLKILPPQKVLQLYRAESQFRAHMFDQYRKRKRERSR